MFTDMYSSFDLSKAEQHFEWRILSKHWKLELSNKPDYLFFSCFGNEHLKYDCTRIFYTPENVRPNFNRCDYAFSFDYPTNERNYRLPIYRRWPEYKQLFVSREPERIASENRGFCSFIVSNSFAKERIKISYLLSSYKKVDSGGRFQNNIGFPIQTGVENKLNWMRNYKFSITFENSSYPGYTTEKLMHALITNTIPIYWGNPLVAQDFNPKAFINCFDFDSFEDVVEKVKEIDNDDDLYKEYLSQPYLKDNLETDFCKEENIVGRFDEILESRRYFISPIQKRIQRPLLSYYQTSKRINKAARSLKAYANQALAVLKQTFKGSHKQSGE